MELDRYTGRQIDCNHGDRQKNIKLESHEKRQIDDDKVRQIDNLVVRQIDNLVVRQMILQVSYCS